MPRRVELGDGFRIEFPHGLRLLELGSLGYGPNSLLTPSGIMMPDQASLALASACLASGTENPPSRAIFSPIRPKSRASSNQIRFYCIFGTWRVHRKLGSIRDDDKGHYGTYTITNIRTVSLHAYQLAPQRFFISSIPYYLEIPSHLGGEQPGPDAPGAVLR